MIRKSVLFLVMGAVALLGPSMASAQGKASTLDTTKAKAFVGDWVVTIEGRRGPQELTLSLKDVGGKVAAELAGGRGGPVTITDITMPAADLVLKFNREGPQGVIDVVMTVALTKDGITVKQDMAGGQFSQSGTGKKKG